MKCFINYALIVFYISSFMISECDNTNKNVYADSNSDVENGLYRFFLQLSMKQDVISRMVFVDGNTTSMDQFFHLTNSETNTEVKCNIHIYEILHFMNIVVSCKYSDFVFSIVRVLDLVNDTMLNNEHLLVSSIRSKQYQYIVLEPIITSISSMALTLITLQKNTKNFVSKTYDILKILLPWYIYLERSNNIFLKKNVSVEDIRKRINTISIINFQVMKKVEQFAFNYCQSPKNNLFNYPSTVTSFEEVQKFVDNYIPKLCCTIHTRTILPEFILSKSNMEFENLLELITDQLLPSSSIRVKWNGIDDQDLKDIYYTSIATNAFDIKTLINFERIVLQIIIRIIIAYEVNVMKNILSDKKIHDKKSKCVDSLPKKFDVHIKTLKDSYQPSYLLDNMKVLKNDLWIHCNNFNGNSHEVQKFINRLDSMKMPNVKKKNYLDAFINSLSQIIVCSKLHPSVSDFFREKMYLSPTFLSELTEDYPYFYIKKDGAVINDSLCVKIQNVVRLMNNIRHLVVKCCASTDVESIKPCIKRLNFEELSNYINEISNLDEENEKIWKNIYLTLNFNLSYGEIFKDNLNTPLNDNQIREIKNFFFVVMNDLEIQYHVSCKSKLNSFMQIGNAFIEDDFTIQNKLNKPQVQFNPNEVNIINKPFEDIYVYEIFFQNITSFLESHIMENVVSPYKNLKHVWDGTNKTLMYAYDNYKKYPIDLQDNYDFLRFFVQWFLKVVIVNIVQFVDEMINALHPKSPVVFNALDRLRIKRVKTVVEFPLHLHLPNHIYLPLSVRGLLITFILVTNSYHSPGKRSIDDLNYFKHVLQNEFGYNPLDSENFFPCPPTVNNIPDRISSLTNLIKNFIKIYESFASQINDLLRKKGVRLNEYVMMFNEWI